MTKSLREEISVSIDKKELAQLLGAEPGFEVDFLEDEGTGVFFSLVRKTDLGETILAPEKRERLF